MAEDTYLKTCLWMHIDQSNVSGPDLRDLTWSEADPPMAGAQFILGKNYEVYREALARRGLPRNLWVETPGTAGAYPLGQVLGPAVTALCSMFDVAMVGHAPTKNIIKSIKRQSRLPGGTKVGLMLFALDSINQSQARNHWFIPFDTHLRTPTSKLLTGNGPPGSPPTNWPVGCDKCDYFQTSSPFNFSSTCGGQDATGPTPHSWLVDPSNATLLAEAAAGTGWVGLIRDAIAARYDRGDIDFVQVDNANEARFPGTSTNYDAGSDEQFADGMRAHMQSLGRELTRKMGIRVSTNGSGWLGATDIDIHNGAHPVLTAEYGRDDVPFRMSEFFFSSGGAPGSEAETWVNIKKNLENIRRFNLEGMLFSGIGFASGPNPGPYNSGTRSNAEKWFYNNRADQRKPDGTLLQVRATDAEKFHRGPGVITGTDRGDWDRLRDLIVELGLIEKVYIANMRGGYPAVLCWDETMRMPE